MNCILREERGLLGSASVSVPCPPAFQATEFPSWAQRPITTLKMDIETFEWKALQGTSPGSLADSIHAACFVCFFAGGVAMAAFPTLFCAHIFSLSFHIDLANQDQRTRGWKSSRNGVEIHRCDAMPFFRWRASFVGAPLTLFSLAGALLSDPKRKPCTMHIEYLYAPSDQLCRTDSERHRFSSSLASVLRALRISPWQSGEIAEILRLDPSA